MIASLHDYCECDGESILTIGQHSPKLWARIECPVFGLTE